MKTYTIVQCVIWPIIAFFALLLYMNKLVYNEIDHIWVRHAISSLRFLFTLFRSYIGFNSLIIALCRYSFIVYEIQVFKIGLKRIRFSYLSSSVGIPILIALLNELVIPIEMVWICMLMPHNNQTDGEYDETGVFCTKNEEQFVNQSPVYIFFNYNFSPLLIEGMKICRHILIILAFSNILEGIMYLHTFIYVKR